jgi:hypothetical protein
VNNAKATDMQIPTQKHKKYEKKKTKKKPRQHFSSKTQLHSNIYREVDEISKNSKILL